MRLMLVILRLVILLMGTMRKCPLANVILSNHVSNSGARNDTAGQKSFYCDGSYPPCVPIGFKYTGAGSPVKIRNNISTKSYFCNNEANCGQNVFSYFLCVPNGGDWEHVEQFYVPQQQHMNMEVLVTKKWCGDPCQDIYPQTPLYRGR